MDLFNSIKDIAQLGVAGYALYLMYNLESNHLTHIQDALERIVIALEDLKNKLK